MKQLGPKHLRYVAERVLGKDCAPAARAAGFSPSYARRAAEKIERHPLITAAINEAREKIRDETMLTAERLMQKLERQLQLATAADQHTAAAKLLEMQGKLSGLLTERMHLVHETVDIRAVIEAGLARVRERRPIIDTTAEIPMQLIAAPLAVDPFE